MLGLIARQMRQQYLVGKRLTHSRLANFMEESPFVFFFDELNQVQEGLRETLFEDLKALMANFAQGAHQFVITTRKVDYEYEFAEHLPADEFTLLDLLELERADVNEMVTRQLGAQAAGLLALLRRADYQRIWGVAQNPKMLKEIIYVYESEAPIPHSPARLLATAVTQRLRYSTISQDILQAIACQMQEERQGLSLARSDVMAILNEHKEDQDAEALLNELLFKDALLLEHAAARYAFVHQSYQEYFVACELKERWQRWRDSGQAPTGVAEMQTYWQQPRYWSIVALLAGLLPDKEAMHLIRHLRRNKATQRLAARCVQNAEALPDEFVNQFVAGLQKEIKQGIKRMSWLRWVKLDAYLLNRQLLTPLETLREVGTYATATMIALQEEIMTHPRLSQKSKERIERIWTANAQFRRSPSLADCTRAIQQHPSRAQAYEQRGDVYSEQGAYKEAIVDYDRAIELHPQRSGSYIGRAFACLRVEKYQQALADYRRALMLVPDHMTAQTGISIVQRRQEQAFLVAHGQGREAYQAGDYGQAIDAFTRALDINFALARSYTQRGDAYWQNGQFAEAITDYSEAIERKHEPLAVPYYNRACVYHQQEAYEAALSDYNQAIQLHYEPLSWPYHQRAQLYQALGDDANALTDFNQTISLSPDLAEAYQQRGELHLNMGASELALADFKQAMARGVDDASLYALFGHAYVALGDDEQAIASYSQAIERQVDNPELYNKRGDAYFDQKAYDAALADYTQAISLPPNHAAYYHSRADAYDEMGAASQALADYTQAIALAPSSLSPNSQKPTTVGGTPILRLASTDKHLRIWIRRLRSSLILTRRFSCARGLRRDGVWRKGWEDE